MVDLETCKTAILSDDYRDFIVNDNSSLISRINEEDFCTQTAETNYRCIYVPSEQADPLTSEMLYYPAVPKCYTHISTDSLNQAGVLPLHSYPTLHLMGKGVLIGFLDSGRMVLTIQSSILCTSLFNRPLKKATQIFIQTIISKKGAENVMAGKDLTLLQPYCENDMQLLKKISRSIFMRFNEPLTKADRKSVV